MEALSHTIHATEALWYYPASARPAHLTTSPKPTRFNVLFRQYAVVSSLRHPITIISSTGILTCCPSTTPFGFAFGPDSPSLDRRCSGNLSLSVCRVLTRIVVTYAYIFFCNRSIMPHSTTSTLITMLPYHLQINL